MLALLIVGSFALLTLTYTRGSTGFQRGVNTIFSPVQEVSDRALKPARDLIDWFDKTFDARGENSRLRSELVTARKQATAAQEALQENAQLRRLVGLDESPALAAYKPVTGHVITRSPTVWRSSVTIDVGSGEGVRVDDPVVSGAGLVGRISSVESGSSQVMLLTDHASAVAAKVLPSGVQGLVKPEVGNPEELILDFIDSTKRVHGGQTVVTSGWRAQGIGSHFPAGLPIGEVTKAGIEQQLAQETVDVRPYADLRNLETIQVLTGRAGE